MITRVLCEKMKNNRYWTIISVDGTCNPSDSEVKTYLNAMGIFEEECFGMWFFDGGENVWYSGTGENDFYKMTSPHDFHLSRTDNGDGTYKNSIFIDNTRYGEVKNGIDPILSYHCKLKYL